MHAMTPRVNFYKDKGDEWRWRLRAGNGEIIADSGEGYTREADARRAYNTICDAIPNAPGAVPVEDAE